MSGKIVVGIDGSSAAVKALKWAVAESVASGYEVDAVHAWDIEYGKLDFPMSVSIFEGMDWERVCFSHQQLLDDVVRDFRGEVRPVLVQGDPRNILVEASRTAALVVLGSRGTGNSETCRLGSVVSFCAHYAFCSVVVVR
jgi:nucleotide-binding universal stress UspA family protein